MKSYLVVEALKHIYIIKYIIPKIQLIQMTVSELKFEISKV